MAEYYISYKEICDLVNDCILTIEDRDLLEKHKAEILAALVGDFEQDNWGPVTDMVSLWENQVKAPSQLLLGNRYIRVQKSMIEFVIAVLTSGVADSVIEYAMQGSVSGFTISVGASIAIALWKLFGSAKTLDDWDFCVYMQAVSHFKQHKEFAKEDLAEWMPTDSKPVCNMHNDKWDCDYLNNDDTCNIFETHRLDGAIKSLCDKGILIPKKVDHKYTFKFKK